MFGFHDVVRGRVLMAMHAGESKVPLFLLLIGRFLVQPRHYIQRVPHHGRKDHPCGHCEEGDEIVVGWVLGASADPQPLGTPPLHNSMCEPWFVCAPMVGGGRCAQNILILVFTFAGPTISGHTACFAVSCLCVGSVSNRCWFLLWLLISLQPPSSV